MFFRWWTLSGKPWEMGNEWGEFCNCPSWPLKRVSRPQYRKSEFKWSLMFFPQVEEVELKIQGSRMARIPRAKYHRKKNCIESRELHRGATTEICRAFLSNLLQLSTRQHMHVKKLSKAEERVAWNEHGEKILGAHIELESFTCPTVRAEKTLNTWGIRKSSKRHIDTIVRQN